ncbi:MAG: hypothetical protein FWG14_07525 [Peptococcaceae bacterium]|nr:hypothetical protein [Peptococcaceae bacterium]
MNNPYRPLLSALAILAGLIFIVFISRFLPVFIVLLLPMLIYYVFKHLFLKHPNSPDPRNRFSGSSDPAKNSGSSENSGPAGVPPGPTSSQPSSDDRDYDIVIDSKTHKEYHIPRKKH